VFKVKGMCLGSGLQNKLIVSLILYSEKKLTYKCTSGHIFHRGQQFHLIWFFRLSKVKMGYSLLDTAKE